MSAQNPTASSRLAESPARRLEATNPRYGEKVIKALLVLCAVLSIATTTAIVISLISPSIGFFQKVSPIDFLTGTEWAPTAGHFGVLPLIVGTLSVTFWGLLFAVPVGLAAAIFLSEYARPWLRKTLKPILEVLAGIPTVALGFFAFTFVTPILTDHWPGFFGDPPGIFNVLSGALVVGLMIVPIIASISEDAMSAVPQGLREGATALGATRMRVALRVVFPAALSGIVASIVLAISRAIGETMIVLMAVGFSPNMTAWDPREAAETITAYIGVTATGDIATGTIEYDTIFAVGLLLFVMTLAMNLLSIRLVRKYREVYE